MKVNDKIIHFRKVWLIFCFRLYKFKTFVQHFDLLQILLISVSQFKNDGKI
jgi:hypothetical protein